MRKCFLVGVFALGLLVTAGYGVKSMNNHARLSYLALENVEALADGNESIAAGFCFLVQDFAGEYGYQIFCDKETSNNTIFSCPSSASWDNYLKSAQDRCIK